MPSIRSILLVGVPLAAASQELFDSREAVPELRHSIVEAGRNAIERAVDTARVELGLKRYLRKRQDSNATVAATVTVSEVVTATVSLPLGSDTAATSSTPSQGQSQPSDILASSAAQTLVSTETIISVSTTLISVPVTTEQPTGTSSEGPTIPWTTASSSTSLPAAVSSSSFVSQEPGSSSVVAPPSSSNEPSSTPPVIVDPTTSSSEPATSSSPASEPSSQPASNPPSSAAVAPTTTAALPSQTTFAVINSAGSVVTSVPEVATVTAASGEGVVLTSPTPGGIYTNTRNGGGVAIVTYTPDGGTVNEVRFRTTTFPNGSLSTLTSYVTPGSPAEPTAGGSSDSGSGGDDAPQLQSGAAGSSTWYAAEVAVLLGAAVGVAAMML